MGYWGCDMGRALGMPPFKPLASRSLASVPPFGRSQLWFGGVFTPQPLRPAAASAAGRPDEFKHHDGTAFLRPTVCRAARKYRGNTSLRLEPGRDKYPTQEEAEGEPCFPCVQRLCISWASAHGRSFRPFFRGAPCYFRALPFFPLFF